MFQHHPNLFAFRGVVVAACLVLVAGCGAEAVPAPTGTTPDAPVETPLTPTDLVATPGNAQVNLTWSAISGATSYQVRRSTTGGGPYTQIATTTSPSYTDSTVSNDTSYYYVVAAVNSRGVSTISTQAAATPATSPPVVVTPPVTPPPVVVTPPPVTPPPTGLPSGPGFNFTSAPALSNVTMVQNRDSVIIQVPAVANARDFRVLVQPTSVTANTNGTESVNGGTQFCAGVRQHQARGRFVADPVSLFPYYFYTNSTTASPTSITPPNFFGPPPTPWIFFDLDTPPHREIEVTGVTANMTVTVEALDRLCPFPGAIGQNHVNIALTQGPDVRHPDNPWIDASSIATFPVVTKEEVIAKYGSLIINGQGWAGGANVQAIPPVNPPLAQAAPVNPPIVLARTAIAISPLAAPPPPPAGFFDDFSNANDTFQKLPIPGWTYPRFLAGQLVLQNSKWTFTATASPAAVQRMDRTAGGMRRLMSRVAPCTPPLGTGHRMFSRKSP